MKIRHVLTIAVALSAMAAAPALAWVARSGSASYSRTYTSPTGRSWESSGSGSWGGGSASGERSVTTPYGETYSSSGSATYGGGSAYSERTVTTPYGGSYSAYGRYYRPPGW